MCGIAGYFGTAEISPANLSHCLALMGRRGPDSAGRFVASTAGGSRLWLLHSRLSIIDLDHRADQPYEHGPLVLAYNGEIYNYVELSETLRAAGHNFRTSSDTEALIRLLADQGWQGLDMAEGMWAFALYDKASETLTLSRDRFGEKPLYIYRDKSGLYFGSEIKFIFALLGRRLPVNHDHLYRYLINGYKALYKQPHQFFHGIEAVTPGTIMQANSVGDITTNRYWGPAFAPAKGMSYDEAVAGVREHLVRSVELRLRADVPLAFCMSGGVDSNSLIAIAHRVLGYDVHGFTVAQDDARYDESAMVAHAAAELGIQHDFIPVSTEDFLDRLRTQIAYHDGPVATITYYAQWQLLERIHQKGYRISISGTGADELFSGYYDHHLAYLCVMRDNAARYAEALNEWRTHILPHVRNPFLRDADLFVTNPNERGHIFLDADKFSEFLATPWAEPFAELQYCDELLRNRMMNELFHECVPPILHEDDLNAMFYSVENRSPFLDRALFDFTMSIPTRHLVRRGHAKALLRDAVRGIAPDLIVDTHRKVGFNASIFSFLDVRDSAVRDYLLDDSPVFEHVRRERIAEIIERPDLPNSQSKFLFYFLNAKIFLEENSA